MTTPEDGTILRHRCPTPQAERGVIWRCACGRRWKAVAFVDYYGHGSYRWARRWLPWPRTGAEVTTDRTAADELAAELTARLLRAADRLEHSGHVEAAAMVLAVAEEMLCPTSPVDAAMRQIVARALTEPLPGAMQ